MNLDDGIQFVKLGISNYIDVMLVGELEPNCIT